MRKILSLLTISGILTSASTSVIACKVKIYKVDISDNYHQFPNFTLAHVYNQGLLFENIYAQIGSWGNPIESTSTIKNDKNITITVTKNGKKITDNATDNKTKVWSTDTFTGTISVKNDKYFDDIENKSLTIKINKIDIKEAQLKNIIDNNTDNVKGSYVYNNIRSQIVSWANPNYNADIIKNDKDTILLAVYINGKIISDNDTSVPYNNKYNLKLKITDGNKYFIQQDWTTYTYAK